MSDEYFPVLPGLKWDIGKTPKFSTIVQTGPDLSEARVTYVDAPVYEFRLTYDVLREKAPFAELRDLCGFFLDRKGSHDSFLFSDVYDSSANAHVFGTGNGSATQFQLTRPFGNFSEAVHNGITVTQITVSNTPTSNYTLNSTGLVTFNVAPSSNAPVAWTGTYAFRARFKDDMVDFRNFMYLLWEAQEVRLLASLQSKI